MRTCENLEKEWNERDMIVSRNSSKIGEQADAEEYHNLGDDVEV